MRFEVRHAIPGRIRLRVPEIGRNKDLGEKLLAWLEARAGVRSARINFDCASLVVAYDPAMQAELGAVLNGLAQMTPRELAAFINAEAPPPRAQTPRESQKPLASKARLPLALPTLSLLLTASANPAVVAVNLPLMLWNAYPIARRAYRIWRNEKRLNVDFLDTLAITASLLQGNPTAGAIVTWLIKLGDWIRDLTAAGSRKAIGKLMEFRNRTAWLLRDGAVVSIPAIDIVVGDLIVVYPGEMIPADGEIVDGSATIDQKTITGESLPVVRGIGEAAFAATVLREGQLTIRVIRVGEDTTAGQIARLVDDAPIGDTRMQNHAERFADRLVAPTLGLAVGTAAVTADFNRFLSLVIVDYGTGIRVAAPTSVLASMTHAARAGIMIKSGGHMEKLAEVDTIVFDKTGTLTHGVPEVVDVITYLDAFPPRPLLGLATAAETRLHHPVAEALRKRACEQQIEIPRCDEIQFRVGLGVEGPVDGVYLHVGSERFLKQSGVDVRAAACDRRALDERGYSCLYVAVDGKLAGLAPYADQIRPESRDVIRRLHAMGVKDTVMLTGDNAVVARAVGARIGLSRQIADMLPADKAEVVQELRRSGRRVAMVGDGINDSPALAYADVGVAMKHGAEITHESAAVVLMEDSLWKLVKAVEISRDAVSLIKQNYAIVAGMNTLALALVLPGGLISPSATALLSNGSAIIASLNGMRPVLRYQ